MPVLGPEHWKTLSVPSKPSFTLSDISNAIIEVTGLRVLDTAVHIPRGFANESWIATTEIGKIVFKIGLPNAPIDKRNSSIQALVLAQRAGIPHPQIIISSDQCEALGGRLVRVFHYIEGLPLDQMPDSIDSMIRFWTELGSAVRAMHSVHPDGFSSRFDSSAPSFKSWEEYCAYRIPQINKRALKSGYFNEHDLNRFWKDVEISIHRVSPLVKPALTHRDLHEDNLLVAHDGALAAILDFDMAESWDPVADFFRLKYWVFSESRVIKDFFSKGYGSPCEVHSCFEERLNIVCAMEFTNIIANAGPRDSEYLNWARENLQMVAQSAGWFSPVQNYQFFEINRQI